MSRIDGERRAGGAVTGGGAPGVARGMLARIQHIVRRRLRLRSEDAPSTAESVDAELLAAGYDPQDVATRLAEHARRVLDGGTRMPETAPAPSVTEPRSPAVDKPKLTKLFRDASLGIEAFAQDRAA